MINKTEAKFEQIESATCDCCGQPIKVQFGHMEDHLSIGGYENGKILEAVVCILCMYKTLSFINIQRKESTIGYC